MMHDALVARMKLNRRDQLVFGNVDRDHEVLQQVGAFGPHGERLGHLHNQIRFPEPPTFHEFGHRGPVIRIAFCTTRLRPDLEQVQLALTQPPFADETMSLARSSTVGNIGLASRWHPRRHDPPLRDLNNHLRVLRDLGMVRERERSEPRTQLLMTLPGANYVVALGLLSAIGDVTRFPDGDHLASYLGLVPSTHQSANTCYHGRIAKAGNAQARWLLTQACQHVSRHPGPLGAFFRRLAKRKPRHVALMALARKLVTVAYLMLKHNEPYRYARLERMAEKFTEFRDKYVPVEQRAQKPALRASAQRGLGAVYQLAGLPSTPSPEELPAGEQCMLS